MKTKLEILNETKAAYSNPANRGVNRGRGCEYLTDEGKMCSVGRCMMNPEKYSGYINNLYIKEECGSVKDFNEVLKEEYRGHSLDFWMDLQRWHDDINDVNFYQDRITQTGEQQFAELVKKYL